VAAATIAVCAPTREEAKAIAKDAIDFTTRKGAELFTAFRQQGSEGIRILQTMAQQAVAAADYPAIDGGPRQTHRGRRVMVGDPETASKSRRCTRAPAPDLNSDAGTGGAIPHEKVIADH